MNIVHFISDGFREYNSSNYRVSIPASALQKSGLAKVVILGIQQWLAQSSEAKLACARADVIVLQRVLIDDSLPQVDYWRNRGKAIVIDFDDAYDLIRPDNAAYGFWHGGEIDVTLGTGYKYKRKMEPHPVEQFKNGLSHVSALTTPSRVLCNDWSRYAPAEYLPNYLDLPRYERFQKKQNEKITIGWGGSLSHIPGFTDSGISQALGQLFSERDDIQFLLVGDDRVIKELPIPAKQKLYCPYVKFNDWPGVLLRYDIGIAPLFGKYDCRRSHLKVMEYVAMGLPYIATRSAVYREFFDAGGLYVEQGDLDKCDVGNAEGWYTAIKEVVDSFDNYKSIAAQSKIDFRSTYDVNLNVNNIIDTYTRIIEGE